MKVRTLHRANFFWLRSSSPEEVRLGETPKPARETRTLPEETSNPVR